MWEIGSEEWEMRNIKGEIRYGKWEMGGEEWEMRNIRGEMRNERRK